MLFSGVFGAIFLGAMEGAAVLFGKLVGGGQIDPQPIVLPEQQSQQAAATPEPSSQFSSQTSDSSANYPITNLFKGKGFGFGGHP